MRIAYSHHACRFAYNDSCLQYDSFLTTEVSNLMFIGCMNQFVAQYRLLHVVTSKEFSDQNIATWTYVYMLL